MATVYLARDVRYDRPVAFKLLRRDVTLAMDAERFRREIATAARLQHPHICSVYDSGEADGQLWYTMPYIRGESLRERLRREGQLALADVVRITRDCAEALGYAHQAGVVHRDVKPENILLTEDGNPMLADFGIALRLGSASGEHLTEAGHSVGTPLYMAPEQAMAQPADARTDQYALAAVCFEMLAGRPPHAGPTIHAVIARRVTAPAPGVRTWRADTPRALELALQRALALEPDDRFPSVTDFSRALTELPSSRRRVPRWAWIALATLSTAAAVGLSLRRSGASPAETAARPRRRAHRFRRGRPPGLPCSRSRTWATAPTRTSPTAWRTRCAPSSPDSPASRSSRAAARTSTWGVRRRRRRSVRSWASHTSSAAPSDGRRVPSTAGCG